MPTGEKHTELLALLDAHRDDRLTDKDRARLTELLAADSAARAVYARATLMQVCLEMEAGGEEPVGHAVRDENGARIPGRGASPTPTPRPKSLLNWASRHPKGPAIAIAATLLVAALVVMGLVPVKDWMAERGKKHGNDETQEKQSQAFVAKLSNWHDDVWLEDTRPPLDDPRLKVGRRLKIESGLIEVTYLTGVRVVIEGPAEFYVGGTEAQRQKAQSKEETARSSSPNSSLLNPKSSLANSGYLALGKLVARVEGEEAQGFTIDSPTLRVEDLGTEFAVDVPESGDSSVIVLDGEVDVIRYRNDGGDAERVRLVTNQGASVAAGGNIAKQDNIDTRLIADARKILEYAFVTGRAERPAEETRIARFRQGAPDPMTGSEYKGAEDVMLIAWASASNFGGRPNFDVGTLDGKRAARTLLRFDLSSLRGKVERVTGVTLRLHVTDQEVPGDGNVEIHLLAAANADWQEGEFPNAGDGTENPKPGDSTWSWKRHGQARWAGTVGAGMPNVDYDSRLIGQRRYDQNTSGVFEMQLLTESKTILGWINGKTNPGFFLKEANEHKPNRINFYSSEAADVQLRPEILIEYVPVVQTENP